VEQTRIVPELGSVDARLSEFPNVKAMLAADILVLADLAANYVAESSDRPAAVLADDSEALGGSFDWEHRDEPRRLVQAPSGLRSRRWAPAPDGGGRCPDRLPRGGWLAKVSGMITVVERWSLR